MPEGSGFLQWLGAVNMVVTAALAVLVWVFTAGKWARSREVDGMAHTGSADSTRTTALMEIIARELDRYDQRRPRADVARVEALMVQVQEFARTCARSTSSGASGTNRTAWKSMPPCAPRCGSRNASRRWAGGGRPGPTERAQRAVLGS